MKHIAEVNQRCGETIRNISEIKGFENLQEEGIIESSSINDVIPSGFGSNVKLNVVDGVAVGIERDISPNDQPFIENYLNFLQKDFEQMDISRDEKQEFSAAQEKIRKRILKLE